METFKKLTAALTSSDCPLQGTVLVLLHYLHKLPWGEILTSQVQKQTDATKLREHWMWLYFAFWLFFLILLINFIVFIHCATTLAPEQGFELGPAWLKYPSINDAIVLKL